MRAPSAPLRGALLGLLLERPGHGGELAKRLEERLGETWKLNPNDVYRLLERLEGEGLARAVEQPRPGREQRTRIVYHPTERTSDALSEWMETLSPRESVRLGVQAKLAVAREEDAPRMVLVLHEYERECLALVQVVGSGLAHDAVAGSGVLQAGSWAALCLECRRDAACGMLKAEISWAQRTGERIEAHQAFDSLNS